MKKLAIALALGTAILAGCVAVPVEQGPRHGYGYRDRDRDGVPNRYDRDRDNDGVPNAYDRRPSDPRRY
jgi:hypothetical protein